MTVGTSVQGVIWNSAGDILIPGSTVRLYDLDTGALEDETISSDGVSEYEFGLAPQNYSVVAYKRDDGTAGISTGAHSGSVTPEHLSFHLEGLSVDTGVDILKVKVLSAATTTMHAIRVSTPIGETFGNNIKFELRNATSGGGDGIACWAPSGQTVGSGTGTLTTADFYYVRIIYNGEIYGTNIDLWFTYP